MAEEETDIELDVNGNIETGELVSVSPTDDDLKPVLEVDDDTPPPPLPPSEPSTDKPTTNTNGCSKKKKNAIVAVVGLAACAAIIGLGLGFGLSGNKNSNNDASATDSSNGNSNTATEDSVYDSSDPYDAVIIGAGWAGISAIHTLQSEGIQHILVLEAANYIGGRTKSVNSDGSTNNPNTTTTNIPYDIGGEWLYNTGGDVTGALYDDGLLEGLLENDKKTVLQLDGNQQFYQQKRNASTGEVTTEVLEDAEEMMADVWGDFLKFRDDRWDELDGVNYAGASSFLIVCFVFCSWVNLCFIRCMMLTFDSHNVILTTCIMHFSPSPRRCNRQLH